MMHFVTTVTPDGTGSRVATEITVPEGVKERLDEAVAKDPMANHAINLMHVVAREHVVAAIEERAFDMTLGNLNAQAAMEMNPQMRAQFEQANKAASDMANTNSNSISSRTMVATGATAGPAPAAAGATEKQR